MRLYHSYRRSLLRWFIPGLHVKRWLVVMIVGTALIGLGIGYLQVHIYRATDVPEIFYYLTLQFLDRWVRAIIVGGLGLFACVYGFYRFNRSIMETLRGPDNIPLIDRLWERRIGSRGPRVVAIGGGHGLSALLSGLKQYTSNITAIVTVADDGGSSGRLRRELGVLPPGDFRMCIAALASNESLVAQLFQYRFGSGEGLSGHSFGNLFIAALAALTGSFEKALVESSKVLVTKGRIVPSTLTDVTLCAELRDLAAEDAQSHVSESLAPGNDVANGAADGAADDAAEPVGQTHSASARPAPPAIAATARQPVRGESSIGHAGYPIERVWLEPSDTPAYPDAVRAILEADLIIMGPGSLFTSVMPNLLVPGIVQALRQAKAIRVYVANVATERGETDRFTLSDHVDAIERHIGRGLIDIVIANNYIDANFRVPQGVDIIQPESALRNSGARVVQADVADSEYPWRHDPGKLAKAALKLLAN